MEDAELRTLIRYRMRCPTCGRERVTAETVAREAGVSRKTLYRYLVALEVFPRTREKLEAWALSG